MNPRRLLKQATFDDLTPDEVTVWKHLANGLTIKETCQQMARDLTYVTGCRRRLFTIMDVTNLADLTRSAIRNNIITA